MPELDFNACLTLLVIGFVFALVFARSLLSVVNRGFFLVDYAKEQLSEIIPGVKPGGGKFTMGDFIGAIAQSVLPAVQQGLQKTLGVSPPPEK